MAPVATHQFSLPFQPPCHPYPDQPNQHLLPLSNRLTASPTLLSPRAGPQRLAFFSSDHLRLGGPKYFCVPCEIRVHTPGKHVGTGRPILATPPAYIRNLFFPIFPNVGIRYLCNQYRLDIA
jgi:hypothetical protein